MGQAIVYCSNCSAQLRGADFEARKAFKVEDLTFCAKCCREILGHEPDVASAPPASTKFKLPPAPAGSRPSHQTSRISVPPPPPPAPVQSSGSMPVILGAVGVGVVAILIALAASSGSDRPASTPPRPTPPPQVAVPAPASRISAREAAAQEVLARALRTENLVARRALLLEAVEKAAETMLLEDARRELERVERKLEVAKAEKAPAAPTTEAPKAEPVPVPPPAEPKPTPAPAVPDRSREEAARAARWEAALSPATGRDFTAAGAALERLGPSGPDATRDAQLLKAVAALHLESTQALIRTARGQKVALDYRDAGGAIRHVEASFIEEESGHVELRSDSGSVEIEVGEILPASLAEFLKSRGGAPDPEAAAVFCLLEGDESGARKLVGEKAASIPERYWAYARNVAAARGALDTARNLYQEAVALEGSFATAVDALPKYQALLRDQAESAFVRRNKTSLAARAQQCGRDYLFVAGDLKPGGTFKTAKTPKGSLCWTSEADTDPGKLKDNFLDLSYSVFADASYKCWIYAGGCCQETFEFWVQGTEMSGPAGKAKEKEAVEPGSGAAMMVKPWLSTLKKNHSGHTGPKQPTHWEWIPIALPKYAKTGPQQLRILTNEKGFSVAYAVVTATRSGPPKEFDLRDLEKGRGERGVSVAPTGGPKAIILYQMPKEGTRLVGEYREGALFGTNAYNSCFSGVEGNPVFTMPAQGELRMTYFMKTPSPFIARFRVTRGDHTEMHDANIPQVVAGRPTELRIPFSDFKPAYGAQLSPLVAGDSIPMVYLMAQDINCGMRLDAISIVELRPETAARTAIPPSGKLIYSEHFEGGNGRFDGGEAVDGGMKGSKALSVSTKGATSYGSWSIPAKDSVTISFKLKPLADVSRVVILVWSESLKDNGRYHIEGLKKGEWKEVRFKATELKLGWARDGPVIDLINNMKIIPESPSADARVLIDEFEIRE